jgi:hypothetical protein
MKIFESARILMAAQTLFPSFEHGRLQVAISLRIGWLLGAPGATVGWKRDNQGFGTTMAREANVNVFRFDTLEESAKVGPRFRDWHLNGLHRHNYAYIGEAIKQINRGASECAQLDSFYGATGTRTVLSRLRD